MQSDSIEQEISPQQRGRLFEEELAKKHSLNLVPNSGAGKWYKLDIRGKSLLISCKWTGAESHRVSKDEWTEATDAIQAPGGLGGGTIPLMAVNVGGKTLALLDFDDLVGLLKEDAKLIPVTSVEQKYHDSDTPALLRDDDYYT